jgi:periplasmic protein TonB
MSSYRGTAERPDQLRAIGGVIAVHVALAVLILLGLNVTMVRHAVETLTTIQISQQPPPPPPPPAARPDRAATRRWTATAPKAEQSPKAVPQKVLAAPPLPLSKAPAAGAPSSGAASPGVGSGAGDAGSGEGGGGSPDFSRYTPARMIQPLTNRDYRTLTGNRLPAGSGDVAIVIGPEGRITNCRLVRSSGDPAVDSGLCPLIASRLYFLPARDDHGRPIDYSTNFRAQWSQR